MKTFLLILICFVSISGFAQFEKGQQMIDGQFSFYSQNNQANSFNPKTNSSSINTSLGLSHFTSPNTIQGFGINLGYGDNGINFIYSNAGLFYQCTKLENLAKKLYLSFGGNAALNYSQSTNFNTITGFYKNKQTSFTPAISLNMGLLYQLNKRFLISTQLLNIASLSYSFGSADNYTSTTSFNTTKSNSVSLNTGLNGYNLNSISFGFKYLLLPKHL